MDAVEQIKARLPLEDVISETVALTPAGQNRLKGLCPFHSEKTPSFHVIVDKGFYYCHGCQNKGDLFTFVQETQNLEFRAALELLAARAGVELSDRGPKEARKRDLYDVNNMAQGYFTEQLKGHPDVQAYLTGRGLTPETVETWGLGYAPDGWQNLTDHARTNGVDAKTLETAGLARTKEGRTYDLFRNRVTIPIRDPYGRIVGFSARTLGDDSAKYVNTPETPIFHKSNLLFGFEKAKSTIKDSSAAIVVEGHLDVIALHQAGCTAAVGVQSATLSEAQITALERLGVTQLYLAFDADAAGQRAALRGCDAVDRRYVVKVVKLPYKDPAETVQDDPALFRRALKCARSEAEYRLEQAKAAFDLSKPEGLKAFFLELAPALLDIYVPGDGDELRRLVAAETGTDEAEIKRWALEQKTRKQKNIKTPPQPLKREQDSPDKQASLTAQLMALALHSKDFLIVACSQLVSQTLQGDPLRGFADAAAAAGYEPADVLEHYRDNTLLYSYVARGGQDPQRAFTLALRHYVQATPHRQNLAEPVVKLEPVPVTQSKSVELQNAPRPERYIPGYEQLRAFLRFQDDNEKRRKLLESFRLADLGDDVALDALTAYLQNPAVQQLICTGAALNKT